MDNNMTSLFEKNNPASSKSEHRTAQLDIFFNDSIKMSTRSTDSFYFSKLALQISENELDISALDCGEASQEIITDVVECGYEEASLDISALDYGEASQEIITDVVKCGYEDASPACVSKVIFAVAGEDVSIYRPHDVEFRLQQVTRRSSIKQHGVPRHASIGFTGEIKVQLPGKCEPIQRKTKISFAEEETQVKEVISVLALTDDPEKLWFQEHEYYEIQANICTLVNAAEQGGQIPDGISIRGLEYLLSNSQANQMKYDGWDAVFDSQYLQQQKGEFDDEIMSEAYRLKTFGSKLEALKRGRMDATTIHKQSSL
jgi:hypothetical protein